MTELLGHLSEGVCGARRFGGAQVFKSPCGLSLHRKAPSVMFKCVGDSGFVIPLTCVDCSSFWGQSTVEKKKKEREREKKREKERKKREKREKREKSEIEKKREREKKRRREKTKILPQKNHKTQKIHRTNCHIMIRKKNSAGRNYSAFFFRKFRISPFFQLIP